MSALTKPMFHTTTSDAGADGTPVNAEKIMSISKTDIPAVTDNQLPNFQITFKILDTDNQLNNVTWNFQTVATPEAARDAAYAAIIVLISTAV